MHHALYVKCRERAERQAIGLFPFLERLFADSAYEGPI
jgi:hypothetical protein